MTTFACDSCDLPCDPDKDPDAFYEIAGWKITSCLECRTRLAEMQHERGMENG